MYDLIVIDIKSNVFKFVLMLRINEIVKKMFCFKFFWFKNNFNISIKWFVYIEVGYF